MARATACSSASGAGPAGPFGGLSYLDGVLAQYRIGRRFFLGAFGGARPDLAELGFDTAGSKYGAFVRFATERDARPAYAEIVLGGVSERARGGDVSRDYLTVESRFGSGNRGWLFERAEIDGRGTGVESTHAEYVPVALSFGDVLVSDPCVATADTKGLHFRRP